MAIDLDDVRIFTAVARAGGFREASRASGTSASSASEAVRRLEAELGVRLLHRTTRTVAPTEAGARLLERLGPALGEIEAALDGVKGSHNQPAGTVRLNFPTVAARLVLPKLVPAFLAAHPNIRVEVTADDGLVDILAAGCDAGIRYQEPATASSTFSKTGYSRIYKAAHSSPSFSAGGSASPDRFFIIPTVATCLRPFARSSTSSQATAQPPPSGPADVVMRPAPRATRSARLT